MLMMVVWAVPCNEVCEVNHDHSHIWEWDGWDSNMPSVDWQWRVLRHNNIMYMLFCGQLLRFEQKGWAAGILKCCGRISCALGDPPTHTQREKIHFLTGLLIVGTFLLYCGNMIDSLWAKSQLVWSLMDSTPAYVTRSPVWWLHNGKA